MEIDSPAFEMLKPMPTVYTCEGQDISPPLHFKLIPSGTKTLVLIMDDPDAPDPKAPKMTWDHWLLYNIPATAYSLVENVGTKNLPEGTLSGLNSWNKTGYGGPCPPIGEHRYYFKLYALDIVLPDLQEPNKAKLLQAMEGHILEKAEYVGTYQKRK